MRNNLIFKEVVPEGKITYELHSSFRGIETMRCVSPRLLLSHRKGVVYTAHTTHSRALRFLHDSIALLRTAHAVTDHFSCPLLHKYHTHLERDN